MTATNHAQQIVQKLWNYCNVLRDDGLSYGDYVEQLTYLLFLKMAHERTLPPSRQPSAIPAGRDWPALVALDGDALEIQYRHTLETLGTQPGMLGVIFRKAQNKIQDPAKLRRLVADLIDRERWTTLSSDVKGDAYPREERPGHQGRRRSVLHPSPPHPGHRRRHAPRPR